MKTSFTSTSAIQNILRQTISQSQKLLSSSSTEAATGTYADLGVSLGSGVAKTISMSSVIDQAASFKNSNALVSLRLESSQSSLSTMQTAADSLVSNLTALLGNQDESALAVAQQSATDALSQMVSASNTVVNGEYLFGGINLSSKPLTDQSAAVSSQIDSALQTYADGLGKSIGDLSGTEISSFISDTVEPMFSEASWTDPTSGWSTAASTNMSSRISGSEVIQSSANANSQGMRYLALASVLVSTLSAKGLSSDAQRAVTSAAINYASGASSNLVSQQSQLGLSQERVEKANDALDAQTTILQNKLVDLEGVDTYEASTQVKSLETQLETAYTLVNKLQSLSLVNYL
ncbi:flagellar hook-associated family protein [Rhizobium sp. CF142]|uniref:flagellar hook-associated family protein n=1 Tax=Rhizobium sp. CF142 TaxID=1144314 RepID=UPI00026EFBDE|nr:flagellar hook-associated family protein [Rhizobium sp. CF142]EJJ26478.1 flagellin/flagellar hook associated protein [Rhizobium sp. CF142]